MKQHVDGVITGENPVKSCERLFFREPFSCKWCDKSVLVSGNIIIVKIATDVAEAVMREMCLPVG